MCNNFPFIFNIQRFSIHDGSGIRTSVFFKGCPLRCAWCHNPESQNYFPELMFVASRCTNCCACVEACPNGAVKFFQNSIVNDREKCKSCGKCVEVCTNQAREIAGEKYSVEELAKILERDRMFYEQSDGGVTLSGGEVLAQNSDYVLKLVKTLHEKGYSVNIDTCGYVPYENFQKVLPFVDTFLYDVKGISSELHEKFTGKSNDLILENLIKLSSDVAKINLRLPLIEGVNSSLEDIRALIKFLIYNKINVHQINLLKYHNTGIGKYSQLDRPHNNESFSAPSDETLTSIIELFKSNGFNNIKVGG